MERGVSQGGACAARTFRAARAREAAKSGNPPPSLAIMKEDAEIAAPAEAAAHAATD